MKLGISFAFEPSISSTGRIRDKWLKVKWGAYREEEIQKFKADLAG
jgi:hypothetical protein